jgi:AraC-like DNA-binding protein
MSITNINLSKTNIQGPVTFGRAIYKPGGTCGPRTQLHYQLVIIQTGKVELTLNRKEFITIGSGSAILCPPGRIEHFQFDKNEITAHTWCAIQPDLVPESLKSQIPNHPKPTSPSLDQLIEIGLRETEATANFFFNLALTSFEIFLTPPPKPQSEQFRLANSYIESHISEPFGSAELARAAFISEQHLARIFRRETGKSPMKYVWDLRTSRGIQLLKSTGLTISEISAQIGFQSPFHFSRLVRAFTGNSPRTLRQSTIN